MVTPATAAQGLAEESLVLSPRQVLVLVLVV